MATLNEATQVANSDETDMGPSVDQGQWSSVFGAPAAEQSYGGSGIMADPKESQRSTTPYTTPTGINWGQGNAQIGEGAPGGGSGMGYGFTPNPMTGGGAKSTGSGVASGGRAAAAVPAKPYATVQTSQTVFPSGSQYPKFAGPTWNEGEIKSRARKLAAPGLSQLNMKVQSAMSRYYENPNVRRMVLRDTLAGYGIGVSNIMGQAQQSAQASYNQDYGRQYSEAMNLYNQELGKLNAQSAKTSTTTSFATKAGYDTFMANTEKDIKRF